MDIKVKDKYWLMQGDCLDRMKEIPDGTVDMVLTDPPYGTTACKWDAVIPLELMWDGVNRASNPNSVVALTSSQPFTAKLVVSNITNFKYEWVWEKSKASNFLLARKQPLKAHESISIFCQNTPPYYPQKIGGKPFKGEGRSRKGSKSDVVNNVPNPTFRNDNVGDRFPRSVQYFKTAESERTGALHPTQKPVALMEYLIKTYTNEGDIVLDFTMGSGTTGVACANLNRRFIGIELDEGYYNAAADRIQKAYEKCPSST